MKRYINKLLIGSLALTAIISSCADDYLDTKPTASVGASTTFETTKNAEMAINGIAQIMCTQQYSFGQGYCGENRIISIIGEYPGKDFIYNYMAPGWAPLMNGEAFTNKTSLHDIYPWFYYYTIISNANSIIANIDAAEGIEADKQFIKAQAHSYRAYAYTRLIQIYTYRWDDTNNGAANGVPLRLDESIGDIKLSTVKECYEQIYKDCEDAIALYKSSNKDRTAGSVWLPNINVAYAVYARAALTRKDYQKALDNAKLARQGYPLMSNADYTSGFCNPTGEWIFGGFADATENQWYYTFGTQFACNGYYATASTYGAGAIDRILTNKIPDNDARKKMFLTADKFSEFDLTNPAVMNQTNAVLTGTDAIAKARTYSSSLTPAGFAQPYRSTFHLGAQLKFWVFDTPGVSSVCYIRSSEMVLIEAEANYFLSKPTDAQASLVELNKTSGRNPNYTCTKTGDELFQEIIDYRGLELWGEGFSWHDYKRWNKNITRVGIPDGGNAHAAIATTVLSNGEKTNKWTWVIPERETDYNKEIKRE